MANASSQPRGRLNQTAVTAVLRTQLRDILGTDRRARAAINEIVRLLTAYQGRDFDAVNARERTELRRLAQALRTVADCVENASPSLRQRLQRGTTLHELLVESANPWAQLKAFRITAIRRLAECVTPRLGSPRKTDRQALCIQIAIVLRTVAGKTISVSEDGTFAKVLKIALAFVGDRPQFVRPLVAPSAKFLRAKSLKQLRTILEYSTAQGVSPDEAECVLADPFGSPL